MRQHRNVFAAIAKRRHNDVDDIETVEQVLAESALLDHLPQVPVRRGDDTDVHNASASVGTHLLEFAGLEESQKQSLHPQRHLPDFVEENRPHVGRFELTRLVAVGAGEAALHVPEQFGFEQCLGKTGAVDRSKDVGRARSSRVDGPGDDLLANTALTSDEDLRIRSGHAIDFLLECGHLGTAAGQLNVRARPGRGGADRTHASAGCAFSHTINHCS